jgi:hypothetical protein
MAASILSLLAIAPRPVFSFMGKPNLSIFLTLFHLALMDRAQFSFLAIMVIVVLTRMVTLLEQKRNGYIGFFQQVLSCLTSESDLAHKTLWIDVSGVP